MSNSRTLTYENAPWIGSDIQNATSDLLAGDNTFTGTNTFTKVIQAQGGVSGTTGFFSGLLSADGGISGASAQFSGLLQAQGGVSGTTGFFSGLLSADGGISGASAQFSGLLEAQGGVSGTTGFFSGLLSADGGISGASAQFSGLLEAQGGVSGSTGFFSGLLSADGGLTVSDGKTTTILGPVIYSTSQGSTGITGGVFSLDLQGYSMNNFTVSCPSGETGLTGINITNVIQNSQFNIFLTSNGDTGLRVSKSLGLNITNNLSGPTYFSMGSKWWIRGVSPDGSNVYLVFANLT